MSLWREEIIGDCRLILGDCREILPTLGKVDAVVTDPPYGTTQCSWDAVIPFDEMWTSLNTQVDAGAPIVLFGSEPFSSALRLSNLQQFKYDWIWEKPKGTGFLNAKWQPMRCHEVVSVFCSKRPVYFPQMSAGHIRKQSFRAKHLQTDVYGAMANDYMYDSTERYPRSVFSFSSDTQNSSVHPTQKPVALLEYLILTYTKLSDIVLDFTMGSGTTGVACVKLGRKFIGIEIDPGYFDIACKRIAEAYRQPDFFVQPAPKPVQEGLPLMGAD